MNSNNNTIINAEDNRENAEDNRENAEDNRLNFLDKFILWDLQENEKNETRNRVQ